MRVRATKFMRLEDLRDFGGQARGEPQVEKARARERPNFSSLPSKPKETRISRFASYTPLNAHRGRVLEEALNADLLPTPRRAATPRNADTSKHCRFHQNYGHSTEECIALKDKIEELIQAGHLKQFVKRIPEQMRRRQRTPERQKDFRGGRRQRTMEGLEPPRRQSPPSISQGPSVRGVINTIAGGFAGGGITSTARKRHLRIVQSVNAISRPLAKKMPPITFTNADFKGVDPQQDDPMVITVEIENFAVMKTLVDQGSSVDILYWSTFKKLKIPEEDV